ncbi:zinc finger domain-containing protein [Corynebacterium breve]|uniref:DNA-(apurinic or apyrimidinic site) lyase n=1 Tax=Corynebacterium breve TaxID=3049799 RepID=A0ABY8VND5_9CORY|nr:DNA-formamidopyrimidine glycosylase family protein [Corynebacterium breve]WIM69080.1 zinc finger domain-containing protein [Corynebacterium breve]
MPEGHVIHRLANTLNEDFRGKDLQVTSPQGRFAAEAALLDEHSIARAETFGKHLFVDFDIDHPEHIVYIHLGLIGTLRFEPLEDYWGQMRLRIATDTQAANLRGPQFCRLITDAEMQAIVDRTGEDPLRADARPAELWPRVKRSKRSIGSLLMDQKYFAGVGNIYRAETLFRLGVSPFAAGSSLSTELFDEIWADLVHLMRIGVERGRIDTVRDEHLPEAMGREPRKDDHGGEVYVYRRAGLPCYVCGAPIMEKVMEGRNLFWCPSCQQR